MRYLVFLLPFLLILSSCKENVECCVLPCQREAKVLGQDLALCACCGGYLLEVDTLIYRIGDAPEDFLKSLDERDDFPIDVWVSLDTSKAYCLDMRIDLDCAIVK